MVGEWMGEGGLLGLPDPAEKGLRPKIPLVGIGEESSFADVGSNPSRSMTSGGDPLLTADPMLSFTFGGRSLSARAGVWEIVMSSKIPLRASGIADAIRGTLGRIF